MAAAFATTRAVGKLGTPFGKPYHLPSVTSTPHWRRARSHRADDKRSLIAFICDVTCCFYSLLDERAGGGIWSV